MARHDDEVVRLVRSVRVKVAEDPIDVVASTRHVEHRVRGVEAREAPRVAAFAREAQVLAGAAAHVEYARCGHDERQVEREVGPAGADGVVQLCQLRFGVVAV
jgi:hypothetical protein